MNSWVTVNFASRIFGEQRTRNGLCQRLENTLALAYTSASKTISTMPFINSSFFIVFLRWGETEYATSFNVQRVITVSSIKRITKDLIFLSIRWRGATA
jgi:hypothetical protein